VVCPVRTFCGQGGKEGFFRCGRPHFFGENNFGFFEIYGVSARISGRGGLSQCGNFADKGGGGSIFYDFVQTSFTDGPLVHISEYKIASYLYKKYFCLLVSSTFQARIRPSKTFLKVRPEPSL